MSTTSTTTISTTGRPARRQPPRRSDRRTGRPLLAGMPQLTVTPRRLAETRVWTDGAEQSTLSKPLVYVPNNNSNDVTVIDPEDIPSDRSLSDWGIASTTRGFRRGTMIHALRQQQNRDSLTPIDLETGKQAPNIPVDDPVQPLIHALMENASS